MVLQNYLRLEDFGRHLFFFLRILAWIIKSKQTKKVNWYVSMKKRSILHPKKRILLLVK